MVHSEIAVRDIRDNLVPDATSVIVESYKLAPERIPLSIQGGTATVELKGIES